MSQPTNSGAGSRSGAGQETGVIHDIGFRHYTGPRLGRGYLLRSLYLDSLKGAYGLGRTAKSKVIPFIVLGLMLLVAVIVVIVASVSSDDHLPMQYTAFAPQLAIVISIFLAAQAPASVSRDLRFRVMPLYFSRPLSRNDYVLAKYAALTSALFILMGVPVLVLYVGALLVKLPFWANTRGVLGALSGVLLFSLLLAAIGLLIASITPKRGFGVAAVIVVLLLLSVVSGVTVQIAHDQGKESLGGYLSGIDPFGLVDGVQVWLFGADPNNPMVAPLSNFAGALFAVLTLVVVAGCYGCLLLRYRKVSAS